MWCVHKFGGTSVGNSERYKTVAGLLRSVKTQPRMAVVVSAIKGTTDHLIELTQLARQQNPEWKVKLHDIKDLHYRTLKALVNEKLFDRVWQALEGDFSKVEEILLSITLVRSVSEPVVEMISGFGEVWSAQLLNAHLQSQGISSVWLDARDILVVASAPLSVDVNWDESKQRLNSWLQAQPITDYVIITGFVATTSEGIATTLKRNGSDFSASIFAYLLEAKELTIWTDVDGVLSADPRLVPEAKVLRQISYQEIIELAYFGAKVVHPGTMLPAMKLGIPIQIKNTFNPQAPGTLICEKPQDHGKTSVRGFSLVENMALINLEGTGMVGVPGVAERLFGALRSENINVVLISQASSEHSICFAIKESDVPQAKTCIEKCFFAELLQKTIEKVDITSHVTILAAVGDGMAHSPGIAGKCLTALGRAGISIRAIAQGSSERNISVVIDQDKAKKALRCMHSEFYMSPHTLSVGLIGTGLIGKTLLTQLKKQLAYLRQEKNIDIQVRGLMSSQTMYLSENDMLDEADPVKKMTAKANMEMFLSHVASDHIPHAAIIDATASSELPRSYVDWMKRGFHIVTPNKKGLSQDYALYQDIKMTAKKNNRHYLYSTNVGAGLPILKSIKDLFDTGDHIHSIEAVLSGTLSFIFNNLKDSFAEQVREAMKLGFTEPDPRDDLSGQDVLRKMTIITREMGFNFNQIQPENLVPENLLKVSKDEFIARLDEIKIVAQPQKILRYVASWDQKNGIKVGLKSYPADHPMAFLRYADNILIIHSDRYHQQPLIVQGPGAGPDVTAGGVFADLLRLMMSLGATL